VVSRLSQARHHSWGHSQITRLVVEYEATAAWPSGRDEDHFLAVMAFNDAGAGQAAGTNGGSPGRKSVQITKLRVLAWHSRFMSSGSASKFIPPSRTPYSAGFWLPRCD